MWQNVENIHYVTTRNITWLKMDNREFDPVVPEAGPQEDGDKLEMENEDKSEVPILTIE